jgi:hypothetical protein
MPAAVVPVGKVSQFNFFHDFLYKKGCPTKTAFLHFKLLVEKTSSKRGSVH